MEGDEAEKFDSIVSEMQDHAVMKAEDAFYDYDAWLNLCNRLRTAHRRELANVAQMRDVLSKCEKYLSAVIRENLICENEVDGLNTSDLADDAWDAIHKSEIRNCDRFADELDAQLAFLNEVWLISVSKETMLEHDKFEEWTEEMKTRYGRWLMETTKENA